LDEIFVRFFPTTTVAELFIRGLHIGKYPYPLRGGFQPMSFGGKNKKMGREKSRNIKENGRKGKENKKMGSKKVKLIEIGFN
jgi:hypothetical protein